MQRKLPLKLVLLSLAVINRSKNISNVFYYSFVWFLIFLEIHTTNKSNMQKRRIEVFLGCAETTVGYLLCCGAWALFSVF